MARHGVEHRVEPRFDHDLRQTGETKTHARDPDPKIPFTRESVNGGDGGGSSGGMVVVVARTREERSLPGPGPRRIATPSPRFSTYTTYRPPPLLLLLLFLAPSPRPPLLCPCPCLCPSPAPLSPIPVPTQTRGARKSRRGKGARVVLKQSFSKREKKMED